MPVVFVVALHAAEPLARRQTVAKRMLESLMLCDVWFCFFVVMKLKLMQIYGSNLLMQAMENMFFKHVTM